MTPPEAASLGPAQPRPRYAALDIARGVAIIAMAIYHGAWDLWLYQFIATQIPFDPIWVWLQRAIVSTFLLLVGTGLVLGHGDGVRWRKFCWRFGLIVGGALLVSLGTFAFNAESFVYFGILHAIALFSLLGLAFLRAPVALNLVLGVAILVLPTLFTHPVFTQKPLSWIGLWTEPPYTEDLVPVFPWFAMVLIGIALTRIAQRSGVLARIGRLAPRDPVSRALAWMGRWSLPLYLVHQPVLLAVIIPLAGWLQPGIALRADQFYGNCVASCQSSASDGGAFCEAYCSCTLETVEADGLWPLLEQGLVRTPEQDETILALTNQCAARALDEGPAALEAQEP